MTPATIAALNAINQAFYATVAHDFDQTRSSAWWGWQRLLPYLAALSTPARVLDVGCGNGRFGVFLAQSGVAAHYTGHDNNPQLLAAAQTALDQFPMLSVTLEQRDSILMRLAYGTYDFIGVFGVIHHVPGAQNRQHFLQHLAALLAPQGILSYATWRFYENDKLRARLVAWDEALALQVEPHDFLLDWRQGARALRYCHYVDDTEQALLDTATGLQVLEHFRADGASNDLNSYSVLRK